MDRVLWSMAILLLVVAGRQTTVALPSCSTLVQKMAPCLSFIISGQDPSAGCCSAAKYVYNIAKAKKDRVEICNCGKKYLVNFKNYNPKRLPLLTKKCGLDYKLPPVDKNYDCNSIE